MCNVDLRLFIKQYLKNTKTEEKDFAKNCGTSLFVLKKFLNGENVRYTTTRKYFVYLVKVLKEIRECSKEFVEIAD